MTYDVKPNTENDDEPALLAFGADVEIVYRLTGGVWLRLRRVGAFGVIFELRISQIANRGQLK